MSPISLPYIYIGLSNSFVSCVSSLTGLEPSWQALERVNQERRETGVCMTRGEHWPPSVHALISLVNLIQDGHSCHLQGLVETKWSLVFKCCNFYILIPKVIYFWWVRTVAFACLILFSLLNLSSGVLTIYANYPDGHFRHKYKTI